MKVLLILVICCYLGLFQIIDSKKYRVMMEDKVMPYIDNSIEPATNYFSLDNLILEQVDDDNVQIGGYVEALKSMDRNLPMVVNVRTQYFQTAVWNEAAYRITMPNACLDFINPNRFFYNISKLWTLDRCPAKIGDKWEIESNQMNIIYDVPPTMQIVPWRAYFLITQGLPGFENVKFGFGVEVQFLPLK